jgi:nucleotide-binding universal stress UspA family protein
MKAPCSVWMAPEGSPATLDRILAPIDFSEPAADSMRVATSLAKLAGAECLALHTYFNEAVVTYEGYDQVLRGEEMQAYHKFMRAIDSQGIDVRLLLEEGVNVAHVIGRVAKREGADLIVMATRGRSRSAAILLGSVTEDMLMETRVPLLVVKHFGARIEVLEALLNRLFRPRTSLHTD